MRNALDNEATFNIVGGGLIGFQLVFGYGREQGPRPVGTIRRNINLAQISQDMINNYSHGIHRIVFAQL